jgi:hypothetical protein
LLIALGIAAFAILIATGIWRRRRSAARAHGRGPTARPPFDRDATSRDRLMGLHESLREGLTTRFGNSFRAKTTEELSADERLVEHLGDEDFRDFIRFMDQLDRLRFAPARSHDQDGSIDDLLITWEPRVASLGAKIRQRPPRRPKKAATAGRPPERPS